MPLLPTRPPAAPAGPAAALALPAPGLRPLARCLVLAGGWAAALVGLALLLDAWLPGPARLTAANFAHWDAEHYLFIRDHGYDFQRTAFFPLFPVWWRALGVGTVGMGLANAALFAGSFAALAWQFGWPRRRQVLLLSVPSLVFMALPYSEAVFFGSGVLVLVGLRRGATGLYCLGLLLSCLSRSAALVLGPAALVTAVLAAEAPGSLAAGGAAGLRRWGPALAGAVAAGLGLGLSLAVHRHYTGRWLVFFEAQRLWDNRLRWPGWPLSNWAGSFPTCFEASSFAVGATAGLGLAALAWGRAGRAGPAWLRPASAPVVFSLAYVAGVTAVTLATKGGVLVSLSRYVYATPYFLLLLATYAERARLSTRQLLGLALGLELAWLVFFRAYGHIRTLGEFTLVTAGVLLYLAHGHTRRPVRQAVLAPIVAVGTVLLLVLLFRFLRHEWVA